MPIVRIASRLPASWHGPPVDCARSCTEWCRPSAHEGPIPLAPQNRDAQVIRGGRTSTSTASGARRTPERWLAAGLRLAQQRSVGALCRTAVAEAARLLRAGNVVLVLDAAQGRALAGSRVRRGDDPAELLARIAPWLDEARLTRVARLRHGPQGVEPAAQRSCLVAPLTAGDDVLGCLYADVEGAAGRFDDDDRERLALFARHVAASLVAQREREALAQAEGEGRTEASRRSAELAVINGIQRGVGAQLDFQAIVDLVGDKLREVFATGDILITWRDPASATRQLLYTFEHGVRLHHAPVPDALERPVDKELLKHRPVVVRNRAMAAALGLHHFEGTDMSLSSVFVPMFSGDRFLGTIILEDYEREDAFSDADVQLLSTIAASTGAALENARLFAETQRLLKETEQRNAELAVINSIQRSVGAALDFQGIVDVVGDKLCEVFATGNVGIRWWDEAVDRLHYLYITEHGVRLHVEPRSPTIGTPWGPFLRQPKTAVYNNHAEQDAAGITAAPGTDRALSLVAVPMVVGERVLGAVNLENHERENAFGEAEVRLLQTIASSMAVALLNARNFEAERQRAAELAIINAVQQALAGELDIQGVYDVVGDRLREVFPRSMEGIRIVDRAGGRFVFPYAIHSGRRVHPEPMPLTDRGFGAEVIRTRRTLLVNEKIFEAAARFGSAGTIFGDSAPKSLLLVPLLVSGEVFGLLCLNDMEREHAFSADDVRLLETLASSMARGARERAPVRRDAAAAEGDRAAQRRAGGDQQHPAGNRRIALVPGHRRAGRRQAARGPAHRHHRHPLVRPRHAHRALPVRDRARQAHHDRARASVGGSLEGGHLGPRRDRPQHGGRGRRRWHRRRHRMLALDPDGEDRRPRTRRRRRHRRELRARARLRRERGPAAPDDRRQHGHRARERAPVRRDAAAAEGDRAAQRRAGGDQQHPGRTGGELDFQASSRSSATSCANLRDRKSLSLGRRGFHPATIRARQAPRQGLVERTQTSWRPGAGNAIPGRNSAGTRCPLHAAVVATGRLPRSSISTTSARTPSTTMSIADDCRACSRCKRSSSTKRSAARNRAAQRRARRHHSMQGIAGSLSFQGIVELVGDKLREVLRIDTIGIRWYDHDTRTAHYLYEIEHGKRITIAPVRASEARWKEVTSDRG